MRFRFPVIANQRAGFSGNPPDEWNQVTITSKKRGFPELLDACRNIVRLTGGLPRHLSALARNDSVYLVRTFKQQFSFPV